MLDTAPAGLHTVGLAPIPRAERSWLAPVLAGGAALLVVAAGAMTLVIPQRTPGAMLSRSTGAAAAAAQGFYSPASGQPIAFEICYFNANWVPPDPDAQALHLQQNPRYRSRNLSQQPLERVHVELGPFRSASGLGDFVQLSGLWTDPNATGGACPANLQGKAELWALDLRFSRVEVSGVDLTAVAQSRGNGVEVVQIPIPAAAEALHVVDERGSRLSPDVNLRLR